MVIASFVIYLWSSRLRLNYTSPNHARTIWSVNTTVIWFWCSLLYFACGGTNKIPQEVHDRFHDYSRSSGTHARRSPVQASTYLRSSFLVSH